MSSSKSGAKPGRLLLRWSGRFKDWLVSFPSKPDGGWIIHHLTYAKDPDTGRTLAQELEARGYDPKTLRFQIDRKATPP